MIFTPEQRVTIKRIWQKIGEANRVLFCCHASPDYDSIGSNLALARLLSQMGKSCTIISGDGSLPETTSWLPGFSTIRNRRLSQVELSDYDLFLCLDAAGPKQVSRVESLSFPMSIPTVVIDHHVTNTHFGDINLIVPNVNSLCELIFHFTKKAKYGFVYNSEICICLLAGITSDSYGLLMPGVSSHTFETIKTLTKLGADYRQVLAKVFPIRTTDIAQAFQAISKARICFSNRVAIIKLNRKPSSQLRDVIELFMLYPSDLEFFATVRESARGICSISFRSNKEPPSYDVSKIALRLGGGGHSAMAGVRVAGTPSQAEAQMLSTISAVYPDLGRP